MLEEKNKQLRSELESADAQLSAAYSELESLKREVHSQTVKEEGLQLIVQKRDEEISEWKRTCDAQSQRLKAVAAFATVSDGQSASSSILFILWTGCSYMPLQKHSDLTWPRILF